MTAHRDNLVQAIETEEEQRRLEEARLQAEAAAAKKKMKTRRASRGVSGRVLHNALSFDRRSVSRSYSGIR